MTATSQHTAAAIMHQTVQYDCRSSAHVRRRRQSGSRPAAAATPRDVGGRVFCSAIEMDSHPSPPQRRPTAMIVVINIAAGQLTSAENWSSNTRTVAAISPVFAGKTEKLCAKSYSRRLLSWFFWCARYIVRYLSPTVARLCEKMSAISTVENVWETTSIFVGEALFYLYTKSSSIRASVVDAMRAQTISSVSCKCAELCWIIF